MIWAMHNHQNPDGKQTQSLQSKQVKPELSDLMRHETGCLLVTYVLQILVDEIHGTNC